MPADPLDNPTRRRLLAAGVAWLVSAPLQARTPTPAQTAGPFYPWRPPDEDDSDLLRVAGQPPARGEATHMLGRLVDVDGAPLAGGRIEIWQCDAAGRYHYVDDGGAANPDPGFQGYGHTRTDADGGYRFRTIRPVAYGPRAPHIHVRATMPDGRSLTTQLYCAGEPRNERDGILRALSADARDRLVRDFQPADDDAARWQVRLIWCCRRDVAVVIS